MPPVNAFPARSQTTWGDGANAQGVPQPSSQDWLGRSMSGSAVQAPSGWGASRMSADRERSLAGWVHIWVAILVVGGVLLSAGLLSLVAIGVPIYFRETYAKDSSLIDLHATEVLNWQMTVLVVWVAEVVAFVIAFVLFPLLIVVIPFAIALVVYAIYWWIRGFSAARQGMPFHIRWCWRPIRPKFAAPLRR